MNMSNITCKATRLDGGPTLFHNWANVSCYLGIVILVVVVIGVIKHHPHGR